MPVFQYTARTLKGDLVNDKIDLPSRDDVIAHLRKHRKAFSDLYVNMVAAGEAGGILDTILVRLAEFLENNDAIVRKVKGAMIYPGVIMSVAVIAISVLLIFVIPTFQNMFASVNLQLPLPTRIVIGASHTLTQYWWVILGGIGAGVFALNRYYKTAPGRLQIDTRSEEHTSELQSLAYLVCRLLLEKKNE